MISKAKKQDDEYLWEVESNQEGIVTNTNYHFLVWDDIIRANWSDDLSGITSDTKSFIVKYIARGLTSKMWKVNKHRVFTVYYPFLFLLFTTLILTCISSFVYSIVNNFIGNLISGIIAVILFLLLYKYALAFGKKWGVFWLGKIYAFSAQIGYKEVEGFHERIEGFSNKVLQALKENKADEVLLVGHSVGASLQVMVAARVITLAKKQNIDISKLKLLSLGHCIPLVSLHTPSVEFRKDLHTIANCENLPWLDYSSAIDGACSHMTNPIESVGILEYNGDGAEILSTRFHKLYTEENYKKMKRNWFVVHFLYLMATDIKGEYDYFEITAGCKPLESNLKKKEI